MTTVLLALWLVIFVSALVACAGAVVHAERERRRRLALRRLVERLKDLAWDHRELDPALSTIIIDEIRSYEKKELRG